jgi:hypothetical protein
MKRLALLLLLSGCNAILGLDEGKPLPDAGGLRPDAEETIDADLTDVAEGAPDGAFDAALDDAPVLDADDTDADTTDADTTDADPLAPDAAQPDATVPSDASGPDATPPILADIRDIQMGVIGVTQFVRVDAVVTASTSARMFIQEPTGTAPHSGIQVFKTPLPVIPVGTRVVVDGTVELLSGQISLNASSITGFEQITVPAPVMILPDDPAATDQWEGVLVTMAPITIQSAPQTNKYGINTAGTVFMFGALMTLPTLAIGSTVDRVTGIMEYFGAEPEIWPRSFADLSYVGSLSSLEPQNLTIYVGFQRTMTLTVGAPAPSGGMTVLLTYAGGVMGPPNVFVPEGQISATFAINGQSVGTGSVTATFNGASLATNVTVENMPTVNPTVGPPGLLIMQGGRGAVTVGINVDAPRGGLGVALSSSNPEFTIIANVTVPEGQRSVRAWVRSVGSSASTSITASVLLGTSSQAFILTASATSPSPGKLLINEVNYDVAGANGELIGDASCDGIRDTTGDEYIEVVNVANFPLDLSGVTLADTASFNLNGPIFSFPTGTILGPGEAVVVFARPWGTPITNQPWCTNATATTIGDAVRFYSNLSSFQLSNSGEIIRIIYNANVMDELTYSSIDTFAAPDMAFVRYPELTNTGFKGHLKMPGAATDRRASPGTLATGAPFAY